VAGLALPWLISCGAPGLLWFLQVDSYGYYYFWPFLPRAVSFLTSVGGAQLLLATVVGGLLYRNLRRRKFALG
jgi:hypothetical protein